MLLGRDLGEGLKVVNLLHLNQQNEIRHRYLTSFLVAKQAVLPVEPWIDPLKMICKILNSIGIWSRSKCGVVYLLWCHVLDLLSSEKSELCLMLKLGKGWYLVETSVYIKFQIKKTTC